ncbi:MAG: radical SAM protein [Lachnospiraceae bacterium]|nr:radical SAM protein [Lachnospiraceae bacterium]
MGDTINLNSITEHEDTIVICGYGPVGRYLLDEIQGDGKERKIVFCDNNKAKHGIENGIEVCGFEKACAENKNAIFIPTSLEYASKMKKQLLELGIDENRIYFDEIREYLQGLMDKNMENRKLSPQKYLRFEVTLAEHCNLNCKYCSHFSPIAEPEFLDLAQHEKDMERLSYLLGGKSDKIYLIGGEPLLYKEIIECMKIVRTNFLKSRIIILSNGLLINSMKEDFWQACRDNEIEINITRYPVKVDYEKIMQKIEKEGITSDYGRESNVSCLFDKLRLDLTGAQDPYESFTHCNQANQCHLVKDGKIYTCSYIKCAEHFNKYFHQNLEITEEDYVDLYSVKNGEEMLKQLAKPAAFCRYCDVKGRDHGLPFEISKKEISEWV